MSTVTRPMLLLAAAISVIAAGCGDGDPTATPTPATPAIQPDAAPTAAAPDLQPAAAPTATPDVPTSLPTAVAYTTAVPPTPTVITHPLQPWPSLPQAGVELHDSQVVTSVGRMRSTMAPWRDGGGNRFFSTHVFGTPFMLNAKGELLPWLATGITSNDDSTVWTMKLREDAVFQDGTPITAADFKAYWEHGAKPDNNVAWGGASLTLGDIRGWMELRYGDVLEAEGLTVVGDYALEIETHSPTVAWPLRMAAWHIGISKLDQMLADENWGNAPIGAGPFSLTYDPETGLTELTRVDLVGWHWNGPHDTPIIEKLVLPNIEDEQARLIMFENGELDLLNLLRMERETYEAVLLDPGHPLNPLLYESPFGGLWFIRIKSGMAPLEDLLVRKALAHGQDMESIVRAVWGPTATHAKGLISSLVPCHDPDANHQPYDPDLARQQLADSYYVHDLPQLLIDLSRPNMLAMGVAMKEYWKDNLGVELDVLERESGMPRREASQFYRISLGSWTPDPIQIVTNLIPMDSYWEPSPWWDNSYLVLSALVEHARSLPFDHPDRCAAFQAVQQEYLDKVYAIPIREVDPIRWVVQPWLRGFESTFNLDFNTLTTAYVARH